MIVIGVLLILIAAAVIGFALMAPSGAEQTIEVTALGFKVSASPLAMFFAGATTVVLLSLGYALVSRGARRKASRRKELHQLRKEQAAAGPSTPGAEQSSRPDRPEHTSNTATGSTDSTSTDSSSTDSQSPSPR